MAQVVGDEAVVPTEVLYRTMRIADAAKPDRSQVERCRPPLGALV